MRQRCARARPVSMFAGGASLASHREPLGGPDDEGLGLERRDRDAGDLARVAVADETWLPQRAELRVEPVERLDLEPPRCDEQDLPPQAQDRAGPELAAALERGPEHREVERQARDAEIARRAHRGDDEQLVEPRVRL